MKPLWAALALCGALIATGCGTLTTKYPIGTTTGLETDRTLIGTWKGHFLDPEVQKPSTPVFYLHFLSSKSGPMIAIWVAPHINEENEGAADFFQITTAKLGANHYINAAEVHVGSDHPREGIGTLPLLYRLDEDGQLLLLFPEKDSVLKAVAAGRLAGTVTHQKSTFVSYDDVQITSSPAQLDAFMRTPEAADLFKPWIVLKKAE